MNPQIPAPLSDLIGQRLRPSPASPCSSWQSAAWNGEDLLEKMLLFAGRHGCIRGFSGPWYSQSDNVSVGVVHSNSYGVFLVLVSGVVVCSSLQEETNQPGTTKRQNIDIQVLKTGKLTPSQPDNSSTLKLFYAAGTFPAIIYGNQELHPGPLNVLFASVHYIHSNVRLKLKWYKDDVMLFLPECENAISKMSVADSFDLINQNMKCKQECTKRTFSS